MRCLDKESFVAEFGGVYEHSPWVAGAVFDQAMDDCLDTTTLDAATLAERFEAVFLGAARERQLQVLRAHPALAVAQAEHGGLTASSRREQAAAGLDQCSASEFALFQEMNAMYFGKYDFHFIVAVKGLNRQDILAAFRGRLNSDPATEFQMALRQVCQIARFRIGEIAGD
jgi:2-oxo-4-hydroxy-4-carboxy-5-ureidoimidazoline decarboxylase